MQSFQKEVYPSLSFCHRQTHLYLFGPNQLGVAYKLQFSALSKTYVQKTKHKSRKGKPNLKKTLQETENTLKNTPKQVMGIGGGWAGQSS
jgi:hypothetical protein